MAFYNSIKCVKNIYVHLYFLIKIGFIDIASRDAKRS